MTANLGATTYTDVTWTAGDTITEAKLDSMVANDQAYDSHEDQGLLLANNKSFAGKTTGGANRNLVRLNSNDNVELGDTDLSGLIDLTLNTVKKKKTYQDIESATDSTTVTFNLANGNIQQVTIAANRTLALSNVAVGQVFMLIIRQPAVGGKTVTWWSGIKWVDGVAPTLSTDANDYDAFVFVPISSGVYLGAHAMPNIS